MKVNNSVSTVIPTFNRELFLKKAIESCLEQTINHEIIVCNHGGADGTDEMVKQFHGKIKYIKKEVDNGPHYCWLDGIMEAKGDFINLLVDDDWIDPNYIEECMKYFDDSNVGFVFTQAKVYDDKHQKVDHIESFEYLGQYDPNKKFKIIRAQGIMREAIACLQMIAAEFKIPYRVDAVEKILRDTISRGKKPTVPLLGGITSMMGLHSGSSKLDTKSGTRLPTPSLISWKESFAVVIESNSRFLELASPNEGIIRISAENIDDNFEKGFIEILILVANRE